MSAPIFGDHRDYDNDGDIADAAAEAAQRCAGFTHRSKLTQHAPLLYRISIELGDLADRLEREP